MEFFLKEESDELPKTMTTCVPEAWDIHTLLAEKKRFFAVGIPVDGDLGCPWSVRVLSFARSLVALTHSWHEVHGTCTSLFARHWKGGLGKEGCQEVQGAGRNGFTGSARCEAAKWLGKTH